MKSNFLKKNNYFQVFLPYSIDFLCTVNCNLPACSFDILGGPEASFVQDTLTPLKPLLTISQFRTEMNRNPDLARLPYRRTYMPT